jgi:DNA helicase HerA-like ATPase
MILGHIRGKITTTHFSFEIERETKKFEFVQIYHKLYNYVLCQVVEIERNSKDIAKCVVLGRLDDKNNVKGIRVPFDHDAEVLRAEDKLIKRIIQLDSKKDASAFIGILDGRHIEIYLNLQKLLTKHVAILAKSGAGKSYCVGDLIEEIITKKIPLLIIDSHGEYSSLKLPNDVPKELDTLEKLRLSPQGFKIKEYGDTKINPEVIPLRLNNKLTHAEITHLLPKLTSNQQSILYAAIKNIDELNFTNLLLELDAEENNAKWGIINIVNHLKDLDIFSENFTPYQELVKPGTCSIINLKGIDPDAQEIIVFKLLKDLFELRKKNTVAPFFMVLEEAHNFCPERSYGEKKSSKIIRTIASEGRKFGLGLCVVSQRPARVDKSVLSQCTTQIILKVTNPNDLKAITNSVEGINSESINEIQRLPIGTAMITGIVDIPLFVNIRPRKSKHGGTAVDLLNIDDKFFEKVQEFNEKELLPIIAPKTTIKDVILMSDSDVENVKVVLVPAFQVVCRDKKGEEFNILVERNKGDVIIDLEEFGTKKIPELYLLDKDAVTALKQAHKLKEFKAKEIKDIEDREYALHLLVDYGYLTHEKNLYKLSDKFIFSRLNKFKEFSTIEYKNIQYHEKKDAIVDDETIKNKLHKYTTVIECRECFVVKYEPE